MSNGENLDSSKYGEEIPVGPTKREHNTSKVDALHVPMDDRREEIEKLLHEHDSGVIIGETGSGKTTRIPEFLLEAYPKAKIAITQPRRVAARSVSRYVANRRGQKVGGEVGYQVRFEDQTTKGTRANFMTDGILLRKLSFDPLLKEYDIVMVDEAHERSVNIDFVLGLLKRTQIEREKIGMPQLKVIVTSATIEKEKFANYFGNGPVIEVSGRMYPVDVKYEQEPVHDYAGAAAERVKQIVNNGQSGDILIFMPGEEEIRQTISQINSRNISGIDVMPLFGSMTPEDQDKIFDKNPKRKVIVSTNIAETSVTIDGVRFVIDSGLIKQKEFNPSSGIEALLTRKHAKSGCEQRKGRAGRTASGTCYRLYTEREYNERQSFQTPEISRSNLDHIILAMKKVGIDDVHSFDFIDKPDDLAIDSAIKTLKMLGALDNQERLTTIGETMAELPLRPELARMVIEAEKYGCTGSVVTIAAMLGEKSIFIRPRDKELEADRAHSKFKVSGSDFLALLEVGKQWSNAGFSDNWARDRFLNVRQLFEIKEIRAQLMRELKRKGIAVEDRSASPENIQKAVTAGLIQHLLVSSGRFSYERVVGGNNESIMIHPSSAPFTRRPNYIIGANIVKTSKTFARSCQPVDVEWLPDIAPQLLEEQKASAKYNPESDTVEETVGYSLKNSYSVIVNRRRVVTDEKRMHDEFLRALVDGCVDLLASVHNTESLKVLNALKIRSGGMIAPPDLKKFYESRLGGISSKREAKYINNDLQIDVDQYCPLDIRAEIDRLYPEVIEVNGYRLAVEYKYNPANPDSYYESERVEKFNATITIPNDIIFQINAGDISKIGENGRPVVTFRTSDRYNELKDSDLEKLKIAVDERQLDGIWYQFTQPEPFEVQVSALDILPTPESLGFRPIFYAKDYENKDIFAYPGYNISQRYDYDKHSYVYGYLVKYFQTENKACEANEHAIKQKEQDRAQERRRQDRETLLEPARAKYESMRMVMDNLYPNRMVYGFSTDDYHRVNRYWEEVRSELGISDADPRKAMEIMNKINDELAKGKAEYKRRLAMVTEVQAEFTALAVNVDKINHSTYMRYGLTYEQYNEICQMWHQINSDLRVSDSYNNHLIPNPENARELMQKISAMFSSEIAFTSEQEVLMNMISGRDSGYIKLVRVQNSKVTEYTSPNNKNEVTQDPKEIPIGGSGRILRVNGNRLTFVYGSGNSGATFALKDGYYFIGRDASRVILVEEKQNAPHGLQAIEFVDTLGYEEESAPVHIDNTPNKSSGFSSAFGALDDVFRGNKKGKNTEQKTPTNQAKEQVPEIQKLVKRENMTEEIRTDLMTNLGDARIFLDTIRAVPEPTDKKSMDAQKISKARQRAADTKKDLNEIEKEIRESMDAVRARSKVEEITRRAKSVTKEMARLRNEREDWIIQFKQFSIKIAEISKVLEIEIDKVLYNKISIKLVELAKRKDKIADLDGELESIIIDSI